MKRKFALSARRTKLHFVALSLLSILCSAAAFSQADPSSAGITESSKKGARGEQMLNSKKHSTSSQTVQKKKEDSAPRYVGTTSGVIRSQAGEEPFITGVNTAATVRVNNLASYVALLNILANVGRISGLILGGVMIVRGLTRRQIGSITWGIGWIALGVAAPRFVNLFFQSAQDAIIFSYLSQTFS